MSSKNTSTGGFHSLWKRISVENKEILRENGEKSNYNDSMFWLSYIFMHENGEEKNILQDDMIENYKIKTSSRNGSYTESLLNKGHSNGEIVIKKKFRGFLTALTKYLYINEKGLNLLHFNIIRDNVKQAYIMRFHTNDLSYYNDVFTYAFSEGEGEYTKAELTKDISNSINNICKKDTFSALTWLLILSLFPNNEEGKNLIRNIESELILSSGNASYKMVLDKLSIEIKESKENIEYAFQTYLDEHGLNYSNVSGPVKLNRAQYLSLLNAKSKELFNANINNYVELKKINETYEKALKIIDFTLINDITFYESIQLMLIKSDVLWKMSRYDDMRQILKETESLLYERPNFTDNNMELYASVKRRQGICINHFLLFDEALQINKSSFFIFNPSEKLDRSKIKNNEGYIYRKWCKFDKSYIAYKTAYELRNYQHSSDPLSVAVVLSNISIPLMLSHEFNKSEESVKEAYAIRYKHYHEFNTRYLKWPLIHTTIFYSLLFFLQGFYSNNMPYDIYFKKSLEKLKEIEEEIGTDPEDNISNVKELLYFYIQYGITCMYYRERRALSLRSFNNAINLYKKRKDDIHDEYSLIVSIALFYRGKLCLINNNTKDAMSDIIEGYSMIDELYNTCIDKSYLRYLQMVRSFHLGAAMLLLNSREFDDFKELCKSDKVSTMFSKEAYKKFLKLCESKKKALELVKESYKDIQELMNKSPNTPIEYSHYNEKAFIKEANYIKDFINIFSDDPNKALLGEAKMELFNKLEYFFVIYLW